MVMAVSVSAAIPRALVFFRPMGWAVSVWLRGPGPGTSSGRPAGRHLSRRRARPLAPCFVRRLRRVRLGGGVRRGRLTATDLAESDEDDRPALASGRGERERRHATMPEPLDTSTSKTSRLPSLPVVTPAPDVRRFTVPNVIPEAVNVGDVMVRAASVSTATTATRTSPGARARFVRWRAAVSAVGGVVARCGGDVPGGARSPWCSGP